MQLSPLAIGGLSVIFAILGLAQRLSGYESKRAGGLFGIAALGLFVLWAFLFFPAPVAWTIACLVSFFCGFALRDFVRSTDNTPKGPANAGWLERLAAQDEANMMALISFSKQEVPLSVKPDFNDSEPFIDFTLEFINASVFELTVDKIEGRVKWSDTQFQQPTQLIGHERTVGHGNRMVLAFRQPIRPTELSKMRALSSRVLLDSAELILCFAYIDRNHKPNTFKRSFPSVQIGISV